MSVDRYGELVCYVGVNEVLELICDDEDEKGAIAEAISDSEVSWGAVDDNDEYLQTTGMGLSSFLKNTRTSLLIKLSTRYVPLTKES